MSGLKCFIYKTAKWEGMYLYVLEKDDFSAVPAEVMKNFPNPEFVFELSLSPDRQLAREDVNKVIENLNAHGVHVQMPPKEKEVIGTFPGKQEEKKH